ncbi:Gas vesicle protein GvpJ [Planktothrix agardhii]|jgi:Na+-translocating ferredoxin:NAD+ oxidoreductase RnfC subunit|uniref:Gas vesicle structural protein n=1 Tax=Planktothrix agardhii TaxID=1160 RepID=A0A1J1JM26_PLAAG|nr:gas vesicle protein [Planktothrix agardhii]MBG0749253.1 gas vesicle protein [Planktothrix agardhii KL2]MCB8763250.1 gas vesicle protein [Planktothrix agardhii 1809]MCB8781329.1 gas vesicle protein [Planktothrix agardhii 1808]MCF3567485.1 gas vesicle protein [Planktothrix agardhii 1807]MCF3624099.1 gas vesicle protein [Planktothrix agardhii 1801]
MNSQQLPSNIQRGVPTSTQGSSLADILERVLDKGIVIAGDISVSVGSTELLNIRIRLLIASVDKAREIGINWWESDPYLSSQTKVLTESNQQLLEQVKFLQEEVKALKALLPQENQPNPISDPHK